MNDEFASLIEKAYLEMRKNEHTYEAGTIILTNGDTFTYKIRKIK